MKVAGRRRTKAAARPSATPHPPNERKGITGMTTVTDQEATVGLEWADRKQKRRRDYAAGLRVLADAIDTDPDCPTLGTGKELIFAESRAAVAAIAGLLDPGATWTIDTGSAVFGFHLAGTIRGFRVVVYARPEHACDKVGARMVEQTEWAYNGVPVSRGTGSAR